MDVLPVKANLPSEVKVLMVPKRGELKDDSTALRLRPIADFAVGISSDLRSDVSPYPLAFHLPPLITALRP